MSDEVREPEETQPGLAQLREAVARYLPWRLPERTSRRRDAIAGLNLTIANVPDGLANGVLAGVNPVFGLYATMVGPLVGGLLSSTRLMVITTTAAASLTAGQALTVTSPESRASSLFLMVALAGVIQVALGMMGAGRLMRFVSYSVSTGFLTGVAVLLVLSQLPTVTGIDASGGNRVVQTLDVLENLGRTDVMSFVVAAMTMVLAVWLPSTKLQGLGRLIAILAPSALVAIFGWDSVRTVSDLGAIQQTLPLPSLPALPTLVEGFDIATGALALAVVTLVQGAGVSQSVPNPDGSRSDISRDFVAHGVANLVSGLFRGLPVGGSVSGTAVSVTSGAASRWASVFAGIWMIVIVIGAPVLVGYVAMPALAVLLLLAGVGSLRWREIASVWSAGPIARLAGGTTFLAMLFLPVQAAVGIGVVLSILLFVAESSVDVAIVELVRRPDGATEEHDAPRELAGGRVTVLQVYGNLFYAGANTLGNLLPEPGASRSPVVVLRLRTRTRVGATLVDVLARYAEELGRCGGRLYLAGIDPDAGLTASEKLRRVNVEIFEATPVLGESVGRAVASAQSWLVEREARA